MTMKAAMMMKGSAKGLATTTLSPPAGLRPLLTSRLGSDRQHHLPSASDVDPLPVSLRNPLRSSRPGARGGFSRPNAVRRDLEFREAEKQDEKKTPRGGASNSAAAEIEDTEVKEVGPGERRCRVLSPKEPSARRGLVVFLCGFGQTPDVYDDVLEICSSSGIVVLAPWTDTFDADRAVLQSRIVDEGQFWMNQALTNSATSASRIDKLEELLPRGKFPIGVMGHSVGGGCAFALASRFPKAKSIAVMAPFPRLEPGFNPEDVVKGDDFRSSERRVMMFSGKVDLYAMPLLIRRGVERPLKEAIGEEAVDYRPMTWFMHTIYQNKLNIPLDELLASLLDGIRGRLRGEDLKRLATEEVTGLIAGQLFFFSNAVFEIGVLAALYAVGVALDAEWLRILSAGVLAFLLISAAAGLAVKLATGEPKKLANDIAQFFLEDF